MPQSLTNILVHIIFSTKNRYPFIDSEIQNELYPYISAILKNLNSPAIKIGGTANHLHILCALSKTLSISELMQEIKTSSSRWIKIKGKKYDGFYWQKGYSALSIGQSGLEKLITYIENQEKHHKKLTFQEEVKAFLEKYKVKYDERYLWD